jgi:hypothetical protein
LFEENLFEGDVQKAREKKMREAGWSEDDINFSRRLKAMDEAQREKTA